MREILFRAKTEPNCKNSMTGRIIKKPKWIYGYIDLGYMHDCKTALISDKKGNNVYKCQYETIGQYTGLTDKNGNKIFEGDIVKYSNGYGHIAWAELHGAFMCVEENGEYWEWISNMYDIEVVGNIHDNAELLESGGAKCPIKN